MKRIIRIVVIVTTMAAIVAGCTATPGPTASPLPTPTWESPLPMPMYPTPTPEVSIWDAWPDEAARLRAAGRLVSYAKADWSVTYYIPASTHLHRVDLIKEVREIGTGRALLSARMVTGVLSRPELPDPGEELMATWEYAADILEQLGVNDAEEFVKPLLVCIREPGDIEPCLCRMEDGGELEDCTELVGRCEGKWPRSEQGADGFCYTGNLADLTGLHLYWLPVVIFGVGTD